MSYLKVILLWALMGLSSMGFAQDSDAIDEEVSSEMTDSESAEETEIADHYRDTVLIKNHFFISTDTFDALKNTRSFAYAKNLDSILRHLQKQAQISSDVIPEGKSWLSEFFDSAGVRVLFWLIAAGFIAFVIYQLFFTRGFFQARSAKGNVNEITDEKEIIAVSDFQKLLAIALGSKNYRLGVRYLFLECLHKLSGAGLIEFGADKTNYQYLMELNNQSLKNDFATLARQYEHAWYGEFEISEAAFMKIQNNFKQFNSQI